MTALDERFWSRVDASGDCWEWTGARHSGGYGHLGRDGTTHYAHRYAYEQLVGPIPSGQQLDHLCRNRVCVNPDHLEPVTRRANILRGYSPAARHARAEMCAQGHPLDGLRATNKRWCRACDRKNYDPARRAARYRASLEAA